MARRLHNLLLIVFTVWFAVGFFIVAGNLSTPFDRLGDFVFMLLGAMLVFVSWVRFYGLGRTTVAFLTVSLLAFATEASGMTWGFPFGQYSYTENFGPLLPPGVPAAIPLAWWVIVGGLFLAFDYTLFGLGTSDAFNRIILVFLTASLATGIDFVLEPVAVHVRGYWYWESGDFYYGVPLGNFASWFAVAAIMGVLLGFFTRHKGRRQVRARPRVWVCPGVILAILVMFSSANAVAGFRLAAVIGACAILLCALLMIALWRLERRNFRL